jgi:transposase-like protein
MEEVKSLRKALSLAEQEKAILKKATIFFAKEQT